MSQFFCKKGSPKIGVPKLGLRPMVEVPMTPTTEISKKSIAPKVTTAVVEETTAQTPEPKKKGKAGLMLVFGIGIGAIVTAVAMSSPETSKEIKKINL